MRRKYAQPLQGRYQVCRAFQTRDSLTNICQGFCALLDRDTLLNEIMPCVEDLVSDSSQHVRAALGTELSGLAPILGKDE